MKIQHFKLNRMLLLLIGLWPYQRSKLVQFQFISLLSVIITFIMFQFEIFLTSRRTADLILQTLFPICIFITAVIIYVSFCVNMETVKSLFDRIQLIYDELNDENEIAIIDKYRRKTKRYVIMITMTVIYGVALIILAQIWPRVLDIVLPINKTRPFPQIEMITEYIVHRERYILFLLHVNATICIAAFAVIGTGTMLFAYYQHICGMLRIARYRIQYAMRMGMLLSISSKKGNLIHKGLICAIDIHRKAMYLSECYMSKFSPWLAFIAVFGVLSLSLNFLRIFQKMLSGYNIGGSLVLFLCLVIQFFYMFLANYVAQEFTDHNNHIFATVYNVYWYIAPLHIQKMILFLLQRGVKPFNLTLGGLFVASLEGFATLVSTSISYFTVMYSTRR